ncbi:MAG: hypothetical protein ACFFEY_18080 [Candidatus Thorarchaeota archaeon]
MTDSELLTKKIYDLIAELKIPLLDENIHSNVKIKSSPAISRLKFNYDGNDQILRGFLALAEYYHSIVIKDDDTYYIPHNKKLFILNS